MMRDDDEDEINMKKTTKWAVNIMKDSCFITFNSECKTFTKEICEYFYFILLANDRGIRGIISF